jgi:hypothetical protein
MFGASGAQLLDDARVRLKGDSCRDCLLHEYRVQCAPTDVIPVLNETSVFLFANPV